MTSNIINIARGTFLEYLKTKIIYIGIFLAIFQTISSLIAKELIYGVQSKLMIDFSLGLQTFFIVILSIFIGSNLVLEDLKSKYIYVVLSRPISKTEYLLGKIIGLLFVIFCLNSFLSVSSLGMYLLNDGSISQVLLNAQFLMFFQSVILILFAVLFSFIFDKYLSIFVTFIIYICSFSLPVLIQSHNIYLKNGVKRFLIFVNFFIPNFNKININNLVGYTQSLPIKTISEIYLYSVLYIIMMFALVTFTFSTKEL